MKDMRSKYQKDLDVLRRAAARLGMEGHDVAEAVGEIDDLRGACEAALAWVNNMRIVPGGDRDKLRTKLRAALRRDAHDALLDKAKESS